MGRASSSLVFLRFCSASSEDLEQSRVRGTATTSSAALTPFPPYSRQEILHFLHSDVPSGVQRVLQAAVGGVDGARREGSWVLLRGPWGVKGQEGLGTARTRARLAAGPWDTVCVQGQGGHSRSLSEGECWLSELRGTWVPFACGSFGVTVELLLQGNRETLWPEPVS